MVLANVELVEMTRVAQVPSAASFDKGMDRDDDGRGLVRDEEPRCSAAGKHCAAPSDRSSATLYDPGLPVIVATAKSQDTAAAALGSRRAEHFLRKPFTFGELIEMVQQVLAVGTGEPKPSAC